LLPGVLHLASSCPYSHEAGVVQTWKRVKARKQRQNNSKYQNSAPAQKTFIFSEYMQCHIQRPGMVAASQHKYRRFSFLGSDTNEGSQTGHTFLCGAERLAVLPTGPLLYSPSFGRKNPNAYKIRISYPMVEDNAIFKKGRQSRLVMRVPSRENSHTECRGGRRQTSGGRRPGARRRQKR
jgi:hypothetical protein